jgi:hypothetical protein
MLPAEKSEREIVPEGAKPPQHHLELQLLDALDRLRDAFNLQIECCMRDIRRMLKNKEDK